MFFLKPNKRGSTPERAKIIDIFQYRGSFLYGGVGQNSTVIKFETPEGKTGIIELNDDEILKLSKEIQTKIPKESIPLSWAERAIMASKSECEQ